MTHADLVRRADRWLRTTMHCKVVLTERALMMGGEIPDAIGWTARGSSLVVECKTSRSDFCADRAKPHLRNPEQATGNFRYYFTLPGLLRATEMPEHFGLVEVAAFEARVRTIRKATWRASNQEHERRLLVSELNRYQLHGITYPPFNTIKGEASA